MTLLALQSSDRSPGTSANDARRPSAATSQPPAEPVVTAPELPLSGQVVALDAGHNGGNFTHGADIDHPIDIGTQTRACDTSGAATDSGYRESTFNLEVVLALADLLRESGATVVLSRESDDGVGPCIDERAAFANRAGAAVAISVHADGGPAGGRGFHVIHPPSIAGLTDDIAAESERLAYLVRDEYAARTGLPFATYIGSEGLDVRQDLGGLNLSDVPKVLIETGNMRNAEDAALLTDPAFRQTIAEALARALTRFLTS